MKIIEIQNNDEMDCKIHCILCGNVSVDDGGDIVECSHLIYIGCNELGDEPIYDKNNLLESYSNNGTDKYDYIYDYFKDNLDDNHLCIVLNEPKLISGYTFNIYKI